MKARGLAAVIVCLTALSDLFFAVNCVSTKADEIVSDGYAVEFYSGESSFSYYIDKEGALYVSGSNGNGEFGIGTQGETKYEPVKIMESVEKVADGKSGFVLALKKDGSLYGWGSNKYAQLGQGTEYNDDQATNCVLVPTEIAVPGNPVVTDVAAGDCFSILLTEDGEVFTCGRASDGQTGIGGLNPTRKTVVSTFTKIEQSGFGNEKIVAIDAAENAGFALSESGKLYIWGANDKGILGSGSVDENDIFETPELLSFDEKIVRVSAETMTVLALTESGKVYGWGDNSVSQLGTAVAEDVSVGSPVPIEKFYEADGSETEISVKDILCGGRTNFVLADDGRVFAFGAAGKGQAGCNLQSEEYLSHPCVSESNVILPLRIRFYTPVSLESATDEIKELYKDKIPLDTSVPADVAVGTLVGSIGDRTFVKDREGNMWSWGINLYAMVGSGDAFDCTSPVRTTLYRKERYDQTYREKNYMIKPAVVMSLVLVFAVTWFTAAEIKIRRANKKAAEEEMLRKGKQSSTGK